MKSMLFSALVIFALASTGCALQSGAGGSTDLCGNSTAGECTALTGDCGCGVPPGIAPSGGLVRKLGDNRGMGLRVNQRGSACNQNRGSGLFSRMKPQSVAPAASMGCGSCGTADVAGGCGCDSGDTFVSMGDGGCGCDSGDIYVGETTDCGCDAPISGAGAGGGLLGSKGCGCGLKGKLGSCCLLGKCGLKDKLGSCCLLGKCGLKGKLAGGEGGSACGVPGCGIGGAICGGCLSKLRGLHAGGPAPYGGAIPHTAQAPGNGTGIAPAYAYPYYTTRGPRDFLSKNPPSIGY